MGGVSTCSLIHHSFVKKKTPALMKMESSVGLALSSGQRHAPDKLHACTRPFVLPDRTMIGKEQSSLARSTTRRDESS